MERHYARGRRELQPRQAERRQHDPRQGALFATEPVEACELHSGLGQELPEPYPAWTSEASDLLHGRRETCGKSLVACQNSAMTRAPLAAACALLALLPACSREPAPLQSWLGAVTLIAAPATSGARFPNLASTADGQTI